MCFCNRAKIGGFSKQTRTRTCHWGGLPGFKIDGVSSMLQSKFWTKGANFLANSANSKPHVHPPRVWVPQQLHFEDRPGGKHPSPGARRVEGRPGPVGSEWKRIMENTCLSTYIYISVCVCVCVSISIYIDLYLFISICLSLSIYYVHLSISIYIDLYHIYHFSISVYIHIYMYIYICIYIYISHYRSTYFYISCRMLIG